MGYIVVLAEYYFRLAYLLRVNETGPILELNFGFDIELPSHLPDFKSQESPKISNQI